LTLIEQTVIENKRNKVRQLEQNKMLTLSKVHE